MNFVDNNKNIVLRQYQVDAVQEILLKKKIIIAHDMGLGKTITSLAAVKTIINNNNGLLKLAVVAPISLYDSWLSEAGNFGLAVNFFSWGSLKKFSDNPKNYIFIFDEAHFAQNLKSARTKFAVNLCKKADWAILLTGTPIKNGRPVNLYPLLLMCNHALAKNKNYYESRYCNAKATHFCRWDTSGASNLGELKQKISDVVIIKTRAECLELPEFQRIFKNIILSEQKNQEFKNELKFLKKEYAGNKAGDHIAMMQKIRNVNAKHKIDAAIELAQSLVDNDNQVLICSQFVEPLKIFVENFGSPVRLMTGETLSKNRQKLVDNFQSGELRALCFTGVVGGVGLNLQAANTIILIDRPWTPADVEQIEARAYRSGQKNSVISYWLQHSFIDSKIDKILADKKILIDAVLMRKLCENIINAI